MYITHMVYLYIYIYYHIFFSNGHGQIMFFESISSSQSRPNVSVCFSACQAKRQSYTYVQAIAKPS